MSPYSLASRILGHGARTAPRKISSVQVALVRYANRKDDSVCIVCLPSRKRPLSTESGTFVSLQSDCKGTFRVKCLAASTEQVAFSANGNFYHFQHSPFKRRFDVNGPMAMELFSVSCPVLCGSYHACSTVSQGSAEDSHLFSCHASSSFLSDFLVFT